MGMKPPWRFRDIIDLEYFLHQDKGGTSPEEQLRIRKRNRRIYQDALLLLNGEKGKATRHFLLHRWLTSRREEEEGNGNVLLPGRLTEEIYIRICLLLTAFGLIAGTVAGLSFFTYTGSNPLNVFHYLTVFVFSQLAILLLLLCSLFIRRKNRLPTPSLLSSLVAGLLVRIFHAASRNLGSSMSAKRRADFQGILGIIKTKRIYSSLFFWPLLLLTQLFALTFNLGMLAVTLYKVAATDIAFGWQSTIQFSPEAISHFVQILALPWSWFIGGGVAYPTPAEIAGSRIILKEGISHLATPNLISWWPFLCFALFTYGFLPRFVLLLLALYKKRRALSRVQFDQIVFDRLLAGMRTPIVSTQAEPDRDTDSSPAVSRQPAPLDPDLQTEFVVMVPDDIFDRCLDTQLQQVLAGNGDACVKKIRFGKSYSSDRGLLEDLAAENASIPLLILAEAWMPPITDFIVFLQDLRKVLPPRLPICIGLLGRANTKTIFTAPDPAETRIWQQKIDSLGDPYTVAEDLIPQH